MGAPIPAQATTQLPAAAAATKKKKISHEEEKEARRSHGEDNGVEDDDLPMEERLQKLVPDGDDFKLVFISSDSSKESGECA